MTKLRVYVDGSFNPVTYNWGAGSLIIDEDDRTLDEIIDSDFDHYGSRQIVGECFSTINALTKIYNDYDLSTIDEIEIFYDYKGIENWATRQWQASSEIAIDYVQKVRKLIRDLLVDKGVEVSFHKVKAHSDDYYNDRADLLAKRACGVSL